MQALQGIVVLDLSRYAPGKYCTVTLADFGAQVITIEVPRFQSSGLEFLSDETGAYYLTFNRNKKSITLNLKTEEGKQIFYRLAKRADVILEGFRPGVVKRLGIDYETISIMNPNIIYCSLSGYGQDGPYVNKPGHDLNYVGVSGILEMTGNPDGHPVHIGTQVADLGGGYQQAIIGILLAIVARERTKKGQFVDVSMVDGLVNWQWIHANRYFRDGIVPHRGETRATGSEPCCNIYQTQDNRYITIEIMEPWFWESLCRVLGREDFIPYQYVTGSKRKEIFSYFIETFRSKKSDEWLSILEKADIPHGPVNNLSEVLSDPQILHRKMVVEIDHPVLGKVLQLGIPIKLSDTPGVIKTLPPRYGEHTEEVLINLGYKEAEIKKFRQNKVIE